MKKLKIIIASKNRAKVNAVQQVFDELGLEIILKPAEADSGVSAQPASLEETRQGAANRALNVLKDDCDFAIGLEGGVYELGAEMFLCNWGALAASDGKVYTAAGAQIPLPEEIASKLREGMELGPVMDSYANETGIRHHKGAIGIFTDGLVNRDEMFRHVVKLLVGQYKRHSD